MKMVKKWQQVLGLSFCAALLFTTPGRAELLGSTLSWQYYAFGGPYFFEGGQTQGTFVVDGGVGGTFIGNTAFRYFNIIADNTSITFDYSITNQQGPWSPSELSLAPTIHNGIAINLVSGPAFESVTINPATNMVGFDTSRISFTSGQIQVDWQNLEFNTGTIVKLDVVTAVPEPASFVLFSSGLAALTLLRKRWRIHLKPL
jgi:hypothetical protein